MNEQQGISQEQMTDVLDKADQNIGLFSELFGEFVQKRKDNLDTKDNDVVIPPDDNKSKQKPDNTNKIIMYSAIGVGAVAVGFGIWYFFIRGK